MDRTSTNGSVKTPATTQRYTRPGFDLEIRGYKGFAPMHREFVLVMSEAEAVFLTNILGLANSPNAVIDEKGWLLLQTDFVERNFLCNARRQRTMVENLRSRGYLASKVKARSGNNRQRWVKINTAILHKEIGEAIESDARKSSDHSGDEKRRKNGRKHKSSGAEIVTPGAEIVTPGAEIVTPGAEIVTRSDENRQYIKKDTQKDFEKEIKKDTQKDTRYSPVHYFDPKEPYPPERSKEDEKLSPSVGLPADLDANVSSGIFGSSFLGGKKAAQGGDATHQKGTSESQRAQQKIDEQMKQPPSERVARAVLDTTDTESPYTVGERNLTNEEKRFTPAEWAELAKRENIRQRDVIDIIVEWTDRRAKLNTKKREAAGREQGEKFQPPVPPKRDQSTTKESSNHQQEGSPSAWADALCAASQRAGYGPKAYKRLAWEKEFSSLALRVGDDARVSRAVAWYCENMGGDFVPVAHTAVAFAAKFGAIEAAMRRAAGAPKPAKNSGPLPRTEDGIWLEADLADIDFPTAPDHPTYTDMLEGSLAFLNALRAALRAAAEDGTLPSDRHGYAAESLADNLHPMSLTSRWLEDIQRHYRRRKTAWGGKPGVMGLENRYLQSWVEGIFDEDGRPAWLWGEIKPHLNL